MELTWWRDDFHCHFTNKKTEIQKVNSTTPSREVWDKTPRSPDCATTPPASVWFSLLYSSLDEEPRLPCGPSLTPIYEA